MLSDIPCTDADQLRVARLPVSAGGLGLPHLPSLAVIARCAALATMSRASDTALYRQTLIDSESDTFFHRLRDVCDRDPASLAGNLVDPPPGLSLRHLSRKLTHSRDSTAINALWLRRAELSDSLRHAWLRNLPGTTRPGRRLTMDRVVGYTPCPASGQLLCLILSLDGASNNASVFLPQGLVNPVAVSPQGQALQPHPWSPGATCWLVSQRVIHPQAWSRTWSHRPCGPPGGTYCTGWTEYVCVGSDPWWWSACPGQY